MRPSKWFNLKISVRYSDSFGTGHLNFSRFSEHVPPKREQRVSYNRVWVARTRRFRKPVRQTDLDQQVRAGRVPRFQTFHFAEKSQGSGSGIVTRRSAQAWMSSRDCDSNSSCFKLDPPDLGRRHLDGNAGCSGKFNLRYSRGQKSGHFRNLNSEKSGLWIQWGSEIRSCPDFKWSIFVRFSNGPDSKWFI